MIDCASFHSPSACGRSRRIGLLAIVLALHACLLILLAARPSRPSLTSLTQAPLMVEFFSAPKPIDTAAAAVKARPVAPAPHRTAPAKRMPLAKPVVPALASTTRSDSVPASAPIVAGPVPAAETTSALANGAASNGAGTTSAGGGNGAATAGGAGGEGTVTGARFDADYLKNPAPPYPPQSRRIGEEGKTVLRVLVGADGRAQQVELRTSSGSSRLDDSALRTVRGWKFVPAHRGGVAIDSWVLVPIVFRLEQ